MILIFTKDPIKLSTTMWMTTSRLDSVQISTQFIEYFKISVIIATN